MHFVFLRFSFWRSGVNPALLCRWVLCGTFNWSLIGRWARLKLSLMLRTPLLRSLYLSAMKAVCEESRQSSFLEHPVKPGDVKHYLCVKR